MVDQLTQTALEGLASYDCVFLELIPGTKMPTRKWDYFERLHAERGRSRLDLALRWLKKGNGVGYLLRKRLAAIDCDDSSTVQRVLQFGQQHGIRFPQVRTPSGGRHFLFELSPSIDYTMIKHHVCHPKESGVILPWDFKLGPRTMLVAPGTVRCDDGGLVIGRYQARSWITPPLLDPQSLMPSLKIYRDITPFVRDQRPKLDRIMSAMNYLRLHAPICRGRGARKVLWEVAVHLLVYHDLDPYLVLHLMTVDKGGYIAWNNRCVDESGNPYPWEYTELLEVLQGTVDDAPPFGIVEYKRYEEREFARWCLGAFIGSLRYLDDEDQEKRITTREMYDFFVKSMGVLPSSLVIDEFGAEINKAIHAGAITRLKPYRTAQVRGFKGTDLEALRHAKIDFEYEQKYPLCDLLSAVDF